MNSIFSGWGSSKKKEGLGVPDNDIKIASPPGEGQVEEIISSVEPEIVSEDIVEPEIASENIEAELVNELKSDEGSETISSEQETVDEDFNASFSSPDGSKLFEVNISGELLIYMMDGIVPKIIIHGGRLIGYTTDKKASDLVTTADERKMVGPLADKVCQKWFKKLSEEAQFFIAMGMIYARKL